MESNNEIKLLCVVVIVILFVILFTKHRRQRNSNMHKYMPFENFDNVVNGSTYNPRSFQPAISEQAIDDNFIPLPTEAEYPWTKNTGNFGEADILDDGGFGNLGFNFSIFDKACCSSQWPTPFSIPPSDYVLMSGKKFYPSSYKGNDGWNDSGCACLTKEQSVHLSRRGGNAFEDI